MSTYPVSFIVHQEISFLFLEPYRSGSCSAYHSCLACLSDQSCGWCPTTNVCMLRSNISHEWCLEPQGEEHHLLLNPQHCTLCEEYRDCRACTQVQHRWHMMQDFTGVLSEEICSCLFLNVGHWIFTIWLKGCGHKSLSSYPNLLVKHPIPDLVLLCCYNSL